MTYRGFLSRSEVGLRSPRSVSRNIDASKGGVVGHHAGGAAQRADTLSDAIRKWRGYQNHHMDTKGWADIAYSLGVTQSGHLLAGRGFGIRTAANGTNDANYRYLAIQWIGGGDEQPTQDAIDAFWAGVDMFRKAGAGDTVIGHSDVRSTGCPGNLMPVIRKGKTTYSTSTTPAPTRTSPTPTTASEEEIVLSQANKSEGSAVTGFQQALLAWNKSILPKYGADGDFGQETEDAVKAYQKAADIPQTGNIDGVTAALLARYICKTSHGSTAAASKPHKHAVIADPKLTIGGTDEVSKAIAKNLRVHGVLHTDAAG